MIATYAAPGLTPATLTPRAGAISSFTIAKLATMAACRAARVMPRIAIIQGPEMTDRVQVWSSGGGTQSAAIAALICKGELRPDISVIVDTEREVQQTWDYHDSVIAPALAKVGVTLHRVPKSKYATVDLYGGKDGDALLIPAFTNKKGKQGKLPTYCSNEWKSRVVQRFCRDMLPEAEAFTLWLGISRDEFNRMRGEGGEGKWTYWHPLIAKLMNRHDCVSLVKSMGWPPPPPIPLLDVSQSRPSRMG